MRPQAELLAQLGFALGAALLDLVGEEPRADLPAAHAVAQAVGGEGLGGTAGAGSGVHPDPRPGDEPEWATHQATSSPTSVRPAGGALAGPELAQRLLGLGPALAPGAPGLLAHLEADPVAALGRQRPAQRRRSTTPP